MSQPATLDQRPRERAPFRPYGGALKLWRSGHPETLLCGPADTGKSRVWLEKLHFCADKYPGARLLIVRKTRKSLGQSGMVTYEQKVLPRGWLGKLIHFNTTDQQYEYPNGSIIAVAGMDDPEKAQSSEWDIIYCQEATELSEHAWELLSKCVRNGVMPYQQLGGDCNPGPPTHWLKARCDSGKTHMIHSRHEDNPSITPDRLARLRALTGVRKLRLYEGKWAAAEGLVYGEWEPSRHLVSKQQLIDWRILLDNGQPNRYTCRFIAGVDWGFTNPGVIGVWAVDHDGRMYLLCELYRTQETDDWWVEQALRLQAIYSIEAFACDPSQPGYIRKFQNAGLNAIKAENDITLGMSTMRARLKGAGDGRPRLYIYEDSLELRDERLADAHKPVCFENEINEHVWAKDKDGQLKKETPVDESNHSLDAARYACMYMGAEYDLDTLDESLALSIGVAY